jgi:hypothetical protein
MPFDYPNHCLAGGRGYLPLQFPRHGPPLDVPPGRDHGQHLCAEAL